MTNSLIKIAVIGAGARGTSLSQNIQRYKDIGQIVSIAEPNKERRNKFAKEFDLDLELVFKDWRDMVKSSFNFDAVIITTLDNAHTEPAISFLKKGCHLLIEKPMADTIENCKRILDEQKKADKIIGVCHTLRFLEGFQKVKSLISQNIIGKIITINQMEEIGNTRFTHNYVRGRWGNDKYNTNLLLHKSCHDLDYIAWLIGNKCKRVSSFGRLSYFNKKNAPENNSKRCTDDCIYEPQCPYSAIKLYTSGNLNEWPARDVSNIHSYDSHLEAIRTGPYGQCVWNAKNNVVDHQVVAMEFDCGATATFTMSGFTQRNRRFVQIHGTKGEISLDDNSNEITVRNFEKNTIDIIKYKTETDYHPEDSMIVNNWLEAIKENNSDIVMVNGQEAFNNLKIVFAAEQSRLERRTVEL